MKTLLSFILLTASFGAEVLPDPTFPCAISWQWEGTDPAVVFRVYRGIELLAESNERRAEFRLPSDRISTLTITAAVGDNVSEHSEPWTLTPVNVFESGDMQTWKQHPHATFFHAISDKGFFRFQYFTP
jgi:hypothetical protein